MALNMNTFSSKNTCAAPIKRKSPIIMKGTRESAGVLTRPIVAAEDDLGNEPYRLN